MVLFKKYLKAHIERAEKANATCDEFQKVKRVKTQGNFLEILANNLDYLFKNKIVELEHLQFFDQKDLLKVGIYITGNHSINKDTVFVGGNATIQDVRDNATNVKKISDKAIVCSLLKIKSTSKKVNLK